MRKALFLAILLSAPALAEDVRPTVDLSAVRVEVTWIQSEREMGDLRRQYGKVPRDSVIKTELKAFSVLGKREGEYVCLLFAYRPRVVDDEFTTSLGHEVAHCFLGAYH